MKEVLLINYYEDLKKKDLIRIIDLIYSYDYHLIDFINLNSRNSFEQKELNCNFLSLQEIKKSYYVGFQISKESLSFSLKKIQIKKKYYITEKEIKGRLRIKDFKGTSMQYSKDETIFGKLSGNKEKEFLFLPRGFFYKMNGQGPLNQIGFRQNFDRDQIVNRPKNCILICTFGGSTTWSIDCTYKETWSYVLEELLNQDTNLKKKKINFKVINFGQVAMTILDQMCAYLFYASFLDPEIVICHDGANDAFYSAYTDSFFLKEYKITYPAEVEIWGKFLSNSDLKTNNDIIQPWPFKNIPSDIIGSYIFRKNQFQKIIESYKSKFIWGQQPMIWDKKILSDNEKKILNETNLAFEEDDFIINKHMPTLMDLFSINSKRVAKNFVDVGSYFRKLNDGKNMFTDRVHTNEYGDLEIAKCYYNFLKDKINARKN